MGMMGENGGRQGTMGDDGMTGDDGGRWGKMAYQTFCREIYLSKGHAPFSGISGNLTQIQRKNKCSISGFN